MIYGTAKYGYLHITENKKDKQVIYSEIPEAKTDTDYEVNWKEDRKKILQEWIPIEPEEEEKNNGIME